MRFGSSWPERSSSWKWVLYPKGLLRELAHSPCDSSCPRLPLGLFHHRSLRPRACRDQLGNFHSAETRKMSLSYIPAKTILPPRPVILSKSAHPKPPAYLQSHSCRSAPDCKRSVSRSLDCHSHVFLRFGSLTIMFQGASVKSEVAYTSFRFPETKSAHLKFSPLSGDSLWRLKCLRATSLFI